MYRGALTAGRLAQYAMTAADLGHVPTNAEYCEWWSCSERNGWYDRDYVDAHAVGFDELAGQLEKYPPEAAAEDLGAHHVTMIEFPYMPRASWDDDGELLEADFARHDRWMDTYAPYVRRMMIFWHGEIERDDGTVWARHSPEWRRAYLSLLRGWLDHNLERGFGPERFVLLVADELHSANLADSPDDNVQAVVETMRQVRTAIPELKLYQTLTYYAFPADVELMAPVTDFACVALPWPERLTRNAPPEYNPRQAWTEEIGPDLRAHCEQLGSYHVASGKSDSQLQWNHAYPLVALGQGLDAGVGHWAYNVARASTWHDWDGEGEVRLDYSFVYDGAEDHERNRRLNPTGEPVVPSIRWEALREGIQVAKLLLALREARDAGELPAEVAAQVDALWGEDLPIQRCTVHKHRNLLAHAPKHMQDELLSLIHISEPTRPY